MLAELAETCGVHTAVATFKTQNYRSAALLRSLRFSTELPRGLAVTHALDETVMCKRLGADGG